MATGELSKLSNRPDRAATDLTSGLAQYRELLMELVRRDLKSRHKGSALGAAWSLLNPLIYMVVYTVVFSKFMRFQVKGTSYPVYLLSGLLAWNFFSQAVSFSAGSILGNASLVKKVRFPWVLLTVSAVVAAFINYLISLVLLVPMIILFHVVPSAALVMVPALAVLALALALGLGLVVAAANVYFRDVEYLLAIALQVWFFLTPILYAYDQITRSDAVSGTFGRVLEVILDINPMTWVVTSFQDVIAFHRWPLHGDGLLYSTGLAVLLLGLGFLTFRRLSVRFAEEL